jgi:hypothetical protein
MPPLSILLALTALSPAASGQTPTQPSPQPAAAPSAFDRLDTSGDGFVDRDEFGKSQFGKNNPGLFDQLDTNKDGKVSRAESQRATGGRTAPASGPETAPAKDGAQEPMPAPERPGEPPLKKLPDSDAVRDAAGRGQMFEAIHVPGFTDIREGCNGLAIADLNRDGWLDLVATYSPIRGSGDARGTGERLRVFLGEGGFAFREHTIKMLDSKLSPADFGRGQVPVLVDFNNDGFLDLFVTRSAAMVAGRSVRGVESPGNSLLLSDGAWNTFRDVSDKMGIRNEEAYNRQPSIADVNRDGWLDIAIGCDNIKNAMGGVPHSRLYVFQPKGANFADGMFKDIGGTDLVPDFGGFYHDSAKDKAGPDVTLHDLDNDGDLDLIQTCHVDVREPLLPYWPGEYRQGIFVWKNMLAETGTLRYEKVTGNGLAAEAHLRYDRTTQRFEPEGKAPGLPYCSIADVNNDGLPDVIAVGPANSGWAPRAEYVAGRFWTNLGGFRFAESTAKAGLDSLNWTNRTRSEFFDVALSPRQRNWQPAGNGMLETQPGRERTNPLEGWPYFADAIFGDFDNDGWLDLVVQDRSESLQAGQAARATLLMNNGDGTFTIKPTQFSGLDSNGICGVAADLNNDGLLDLVFPADPDNSGAATDPTRYESRIYWNTGDAAGTSAKTNHWLRLRFSGVTDAALIGARVDLIADGKKQTRWIHANHSYKSGSPLEAHFGLGKASAADITITLPGGKTISLESLAADRIVDMNLTTRGVTTVEAKKPTVPEIK